MQDQNQHEWSIAHCVFLGKEASHACRKIHVHQTMYNALFSQNTTAIWTKILQQPVTFTTQQRDQFEWALFRRDNRRENTASLIAIEMKNHQDILQCSTISVISLQNLWNPAQSAPNNKSFEMDSPLHQKWTLFNKWKKTKVFLGDLMFRRD